MGNKPASALQSGFIVTPNATANDTRRFGVFEVDLRAGELRRQGTKIKLQEQPFQILAHLLERPGEIVTREELRQRLWPSDTFVDFDHSLNAAVRRLRDALDDSAENPRFVETVARRGYRFLAPVTVGMNGSGLHEVPASIVALSTPRRQYRWWIAAALSAIVLTVAGLVAGITLTWHATRPLRVTQVTANPLDDPVRAAAISPDGRYLAFADDYGLYLRQIDTGETHPVSLPDGLWTDSISWFSDSSHMVVRLSGLNQSAGIWELSTMGGNARKLVDDGRNPAVSPDGKLIAFIAGDWAHQKVILVGRNGEQPRDVAGGGGDLIGDLTWSPDGQRIAYTAAKATYGYGAQGSIAVVDVNGSDSNRKSSAPHLLLTQAGLEAPVTWAHDGRIIFALEEPRPRQIDSNLWAIHTDGRKQLGPQLRLSNDSGSVHSLAASADGKRIVYVKRVPEPDVYVANVNPSGTISEPERLTLDDHQDLPYDWTPDNKQVIFMSDRTGTFDIYKQGFGQIVPDLLVSGMQESVIARLSPDGSQILYAVYPSEGDPNYKVPLMRVPLSGGPPKEVVREDWISNHQCARSPATLCIYSVATNTNLTFFTFDLVQGTKAKVLQIKDDLPALYNWSLSPDGTTLAIAKGKWGGELPRIHLVSLVGAPDRWLSIDGWPGIRSIDWAADSKGIWASTTGDKENTLLHVDLRGTARAVWTPKNRHVEWAIPSRDGKHLALHVHSVSANAWLLEKP